MGMPGRMHAAANAYRYGFNGKENDNEVKGEGYQQDYGFRIYDPRIGKFLSVDPLSEEYPWYSPYQFAGNKVIEAVDVDGAEEFYKNQQSAYYNSLMQRRQGEQFSREVLQPYLSFEIIKPDIYGDAQIGPRWDVNGRVNRINWAYWTQVGDNVRGGIGGSIGYLVDGDRGAQIGAGFDNVATAFVLAKSNSQPTGTPSKGLLNRQTKVLPVASSNRQNIAANGKNTSASNLNAANKIATTKIEKQAILAKRTDPQMGFSSAGKEYRGTGYQLVDGKFSARNQGLSGTYDFVITNEGRLLLGHGHYYLSGSASTVQAAGEIQMWNGRVKNINNASGHYLPSANEARNFGKLLQNQGVNVSGATLNIYSQGSKVPEKIKL